MVIRKDFRGGISLPDSIQALRNSVTDGMESGISNIRCIAYGIGIPVSGLVDTIA